MSSHYSLSLSLSLFSPYSLSSPTPEVSWSKLSGEFPDKRTSIVTFQKILRIVNVSDADAGEYRCTAHNRLASIHHTIRVTVKGMSCDLAVSSDNSSTHVAYSRVCLAPDSAPALLMWTPPAFPVCLSLSYPFNNTTTLSLSYSFNNTTKNCEERG